MWKPVRETSISTLHFSYIQLVSVVRGERLLRLTGAVSEVSQVLFRLSRWENLEHAKEI